MTRKQFTFYKSFMDGIGRIRNKSARCDAYESIIRYALDGVEPDLEKLPDSAATAFIMARPVLDAGRKKAEAGSAGRPGTNRKDAETESKDIETNGKDTGANREQEKEQVKEQVQEQMLKESTKEKRPRFSPPTLEEVQVYIAQKGYNVDPVKFWHHYNGNGWMVGKNKMKNWQSAVVTWSRSERKPGVTVSQAKPTTDVKALYQALLEEEG